MIMVVVKEHQYSHRKRMEGVKKIRLVECVGARSRRLGRIRRENGSVKATEKVTGDPSLDAEG